MNIDDTGPGVLSPYHNWNINIIKTDDQELMAQVYDWDLAGFVLKYPNPGDRFAKAEARLKANPDFTNAGFNTVHQRFVEAKSTIDRAVNETFAGPLADPEGSANARRYLSEFFNWLTSHQGP